MSGSNKPPLLIIGRGKLPPRVKAVHRGDVSVYFAFPLFMSPDLVFPQLVIDDFRRQFPGRAAIEFMLNKGNSYPRADVIGARLPDLKRADLYMKEVDVAAGLRAVAFSGPFEGIPLARIGTVVWLDNDAGDVLEPADAGESLLKYAALCCRCSPARLPDLLDIPASTVGS